MAYLSSYPESAKVGRIGANEMNSHPGPSTPQSLDDVLQALDMLIQRVDTAAGEAYKLRSRVEGDRVESAPVATAPSGVIVGGKLGEALRLLENIDARLNDLCRDLSGLSARL